MNIAEVRVVGREPHLACGTQKVRRWAYERGVETEQCDELGATSVSYSEPPGLCSNSELPEAAEDPAPKSQLAAARPGPNRWETSCKTPTTQPTVPYLVGVCK
jgi:hypothetical protein